MSIMTSGVHATHSVARDHCLSSSRRAYPENRPVDAPPGPTEYGRMFPGLPPLTVDERVLIDAGKRGGLCDRAAAAEVVARGLDEAREAAGWPLFGQFVAHDVTADRSPLASHVDAAALRNVRVPKLNLEMVHGAGPAGSPFLYDVNNPAKLLTGDGGVDLPRNQQGTALIGDPRDDVHLFIATLHLAFLHAHNGLVDWLRADGVTEGDLYVEARRALVWHYQWIVAHDFLPRVCGTDAVLRLLTQGPRFFDPPPGEAFIPLEFADAAYRYGHSQIRDHYRLVPGGEPYPLFPDLVGFGPIPAEHRVDWAMLFDLPGRLPAQRAKRIDGRLPASLIALPNQVVGDVPAAEFGSLAVRDMLRGNATDLPSGEDLARHVGIEPLSSSEVGSGFTGAATPLWFYLLKEAEVREDGDRLGPLGALIVSEVLIGLLRADPGSWLSVHPSWKPFLPARDTFGLADLLTFAGDVAAGIADGHAPAADVG
jgi:hypothetical protein